MEAPYRIAIIGAGPVSIALVTQLLAAGHSVTISNSRGPDSLHAQEKATGATAVETSLAVSQADVVILAVPMGSVTSLRPIIDAAFRRDAVLIDSGNYYPSRDGNIESIDNGVAETAWVSRMLSRPAVKAFNNIIAANIVRSARPKRDHARVTLPVCGNDDKYKTVVMKLVDQVGFDPYDAGHLAESWRQQPGTPAYCTEPTLEELVKLLATADREKAIVNRDSSREIIEKLPPDYDPGILLHVARLSVGLDKFKPRAWFAAILFLWALVKIRVLGHA